MKEKIYYIYKITILTGNWKDKYYIGKHETYDINDGYLGSGRKITSWFKKKNRIEDIDYKKEIICFCDDFDSMMKLEEYYIGDKYETDPLCLNLMVGGFGGSLSSKSIKKMQKTKEKTQDLRRQKARDTWKKKSAEEYSQICSNMSKGWTKEAREKAGKQRHEYYTNRSEAEAELHSIHCREAQKKYWGSVTPEYKLEHAIKSNKWKEDKEKYLIWLSKQGHAKGTIWMNNGIKNKRVIPEDVEYYKSIGYTYNRLPRKIQ